MKIGRHAAFYANGMREAQDHASASVFPRGMSSNWGGRSGASVHMAPAVLRHASGKRQEVRRDSS